MSDLYLLHHGIKGQKWGVRRYQNTDGSLTTAGKKHYSKDLYKSISKNNGKLNRVDYKEQIVSRIKDDKRVKDYVDAHAKEYSKVLNDYWDASEAVANEYEHHYNERYQRAYDKAIKNGGDPNAKHFDDYVYELMSEDESMAKLEEKEQKTIKQLEEYIKTAEPLANDLLGKYADMPAHALYDHTASAKKYVVSAIEDVLTKRVIEDGKK